MRLASSSLLPGHTLDYDRIMGMKRVAGGSRKLDWATDMAQPLANWRPISTSLLESRMNGFRRPRLLPHAVLPHAVLIALLSVVGLLAPDRSARAQPEDNPNETRAENQQVILIRGGLRPIRRIVHFDQMAIFTADSESQTKPPPTLREMNVVLVLDRGESARWDNQTIYRVSGRPLSGREQMELARLLESKYEWATTAGALIRSSKVPYVMLQRLIVQFKKGVSDEQARALHHRLGADSVKISRRDSQRQTVAFSKRPIIELFNEYQKSELVRWVSPDMIVPRTASPPSSDSSSALTPWHHDNIGPSAGASTDVVDADVDSKRAWEITRGDDSIVVAIIDEGFERSHVEFRLWTNVAEETGTPGHDDDHNGLVDDVFGYDFDGGDPDVARADHGTKAAGCVAAKGDNMHGIYGICPNARLMLLGARNVSTIMEAIDYATCEGADVICIPQRLLPKHELQDAIAHAVDSGRANKGCIVCCALESTTGSGMITDLDSVIAVRNSNSQDVLARGTVALGHSMSVLAPGRRVASTRKSTTARPPPAYGTFDGSSAATSIQSGAVALVLSARSDLTWRQVRRLMQDTCDKIDPEEANYGDSSGYSEPAEDSTHGFGRINVWEAARLVAPTVMGGLDGVDVFVRDQAYDWGNTERPSNVLFDPDATIVSHSHSPDIKVDSGPVFYAPPTTSEQFGQRPDEQPASAQPARIYLRIRNRGLATATGIRVRVFATPQTDLPPMPIDSTGETLPTPAPGAGWTLVGETTVDVEYSGCSLAGDPHQDDARIVRFDWTPSAGNATLLAVIDSANDPLTTDETDVDRAVPRDNNLALRRFESESPAALTRTRARYSPRTRRPRAGLFSRWRRCRPRR